ncbi:TPA: hypothetical protein ACFPV6_000932, partial [Neisseria meningitidis]
NYNPLPADARTFRAAHSPFPAPQIRLFFRQGFSPPLFPVFLSPTRVRAPCRTVPHFRARTASFRHPVLCFKYPCFRKKCRCFNTQDDI